MCALQHRPCNCFVFFLLKAIEHFDKSLLLFDKSFFVIRHSTSVVNCLFVSVLSQKNHEEKVLRSSPRPPNSTLRAVSWNSQSFSPRACWHPGGRWGQKKQGSLMCRIFGFHRDEMQTTHTSNMMSPGGKLGRDAHHPRLELAGASSSTALPLPPGKMRNG